MRARETPIDSEEFLGEANLGHGSSKQTAIMMMSSLILREINFHVRSLPFAESCPYCLCPCTHTFKT